MPYEQHQAYLASIGLEPETTAAGWVQLRLCRDSNLPLRWLRVAAPLPHVPLPWCTWHAWCTLKPRHSHPAHPAPPNWSREWVGEVPGLAQPLQDPQHAFNSYYKEVGWQRRVCKRPALRPVLSSILQPVSNSALPPFALAVQEAEAVFKHKLGRLL